MTTRPTSYPEWGSNLSNVVEPLAGQKASGWAVGQTGVGSYENWKANLVDNWLRYLDERVTTGVQHIPATAGALTAWPSHVKYLPFLDATDAPETPASTHIHTQTSGSYTLAADGRAIYFPIDLETGDVITSYSLGVNKTTGAAVVLNSQLIYTETGVENATAGYTVANSSAAPGLVQLTPSPTPSPAIVVAGRTYYIKFFLSGTLNTGDVIYTAQVTYSRPTSALFGDFRWRPRAVGETFTVPISMREGAKLTGVEALCTASGPGDTMSMKIYRNVSTVGGAAFGTRTQLGTTQTSTGTGFTESIAVTGLTDVAAAYSQYYAEFTVVSLSVPATGSLWLDGIYVTTTLG